MIPQFDVWQQINRAMTRAETGIDPDRYRFVTAPGETWIVREGLTEHGVKAHQLKYYNIHENPAVDPGSVLIMDVFEIHRN